MSTRTKSLQIGALALVLLTCGGDIRREAGEMLRDAGDFLQSMDATAQGGPVATHVITADTDLSRLESGIATALTTTQLVAGPIVVTDLVGYPQTQFWIAAVGACSTATTSFATGEHSPVTGVRIPVRTGQALCARSDSQAALLWTGFRPYE